MRRIAANYIFPVTSAPIHNGYVDFTDDGTVAGIGRLTEETGSTEFHNGILVPGFTNAHCHIELSHLEGKFREATGMSGFIDQINALRESAPEEERQKAMRHQFKKMYDEGVSAMADISNCDESFAMKSEGPMYTRTFIEVFGSEPQDAPAVIEDARKLAGKAAEAGIDAGITPHSPYTMSPDLLRMASAEGLKAGFISYHNQESQEEDDMIGFHRGPLYENYINRGLSVAPATGKPAVFHFLDQLRKVHPAPFDEHILLIHNTVAGEDSIRAAESILRNCTWVTCPLSNIFIHRTMADLPLLMRMGVRIAVGTDSLSSNHVLSIVEEIKCIQSRYPEIPLETILQWCCLNGAAALGKDGVLGSFDTGKRPGAVLIDAIDFDRMRLTSESTSRRLI
ncbi:MAG TPA: amidohydrolase family protein [Candidatus Coprenecus stercoravium]|uniref:Amidohydrolase family protein n=1 Tax=Candidatus Coprenecus stercoravium TaxID=2840735 RepID=A0A9D2K9Z1_9BACT|nr:amidohydrolase family protein [Candidatus Coprenecus stercoravium]